MDSPESFTIRTLELKTENITDQPIKLEAIKEEPLSDNDDNSKNSTIQESSVSTGKKPSIRKLRVICDLEECEHCKEQQLAYCFLNYHPCSFVGSDKCQICFDLSRHLARCSQSDNDILHIGCAIINCIFCGTEFDNVPDLKQHECKVIENTSYVCYVCQYKCTKIKILMRHMYTHCALLPYNCQFCTESFHLDKYLQNHIKESHQNQNSFPDTKRKKSPEKLQDGVIVKLEVEAVYSDSDEHENEKTDPLSADGLSNETDETPKTSTTTITTNSIKKELTCEVIVKEEISEDFVDDSKSNEINSELLSLQESLKSLLGWDGQTGRLCQKKACRECSNNKSALCFKMFHFCNSPVDPSSCTVCTRTTEHLKKVIIPKHKDIVHMSSLHIRCCFCLNLFESFAKLEGHSCVFDQQDGSRRCFLCGFTFSTMEKLYTHLFHHYKIKAYACTICGKCYVEDKVRINHEKTHTAQRKFKCTACNMDFIHSRDHKTHMFSHGQSKPFQCDQCERTFSARYMLREHIITHMEQKPYKCKDCENSFVKKRNLERHIFMRHHNGGIVCETCGKKVSDLIAMEAHRTLHEKEALHRCPHCAKGYTTPASLKRHVVTHTNIRHSCNLCAYTTHYMFQLRSHELRHKDIKPFNCSFCIRTFLQKRSLQRHEAKCPIRAAKLRHTSTQTKTEIKSLEDSDEDLSDQDSLIIDEQSALSTNCESSSPDNSQESRNSGKRKLSIGNIEVRKKLSTVDCGTNCD